MLTQYLYYHIFSSFRNILFSALAPQKYAPPPSQRSPPPPRDRPQRIGIRLKCMFFVHSPIFQGQLIGEKHQTETLIFWVLQRGLKKMPKKGYIHCLRAFKKYSFQICRFSHTKIIGYFRFFLLRPDFLPLFNPILCIKIRKKSYLYLFIKSHKISR